MLKKLTAVLCILCMLCTMVPAMVAFADANSVTVASDYFKNNIAKTDAQTTFRSSGIVTIRKNDDDSVTLMVSGNATGLGDRTGISGTWINTGYAEATFDYEFAALPEGATRSAAINSHLVNWFNSHMLTDDGKKHTVKLVIDAVNLDADGNMSITYYEKEYGADDSEYVQKAKVSSAKASDFSVFQPQWKIWCEGYPTDAATEFLTVDNYNIVEMYTDGKIRDLTGGIYTTEDTVDVDFYLPLGYTTASLSVGGNVVATYTPDTYASGCWKTTVDLGECSGKNIPIVLTYTDSNGTKSVSTSISEVVISKINKSVYTDDFESTATFAEGATTATSYSGIGGITAGQDDGKSIMNISKEKMFNDNPVFKYEITDGTAAQKQIMKVIANDTYPDGYYPEMELDLYVTNSNYRFCYMLKDVTNAWKAGWLNLELDLTPNEWHTIKARLYNDRNQLYIYVDDVFVKTITVNPVTGFGSIGFGLRATGTVADTCTLYIDNFKVNAWAPVCQDLAATMDTNAKTVKATFKTGADAASENVCTAIVATYNGNQLSECKTYPVVSTEQGLISFDETFNATKAFDSAKVMVWDSVEGLKPLTEAVLAAAAAQ